MEVADTNVDYDPEIKLPLYAQAGIREAWLVDLESETVEVYRQPSPGGYQGSRLVHRSENVTTEAVTDVEFPAPETLGPQHYGLNNNMSSCSASGAGEPLARECAGTRERCP